MTSYYNRMFIHPMTAIFLGAVCTDPDRVMDCACIYLMCVSETFVLIKYLTDIYCAQLSTNS